VKRRPVGEGGVYLIGKDSRLCENARDQLHALVSSLATRGRFPFLPVSRHHLPSSSSPLIIMPTCRRKRVVLTEPSEALLQAAKSDPNKDVFYLEQTGEIFDSYEYALSQPTPHISSHLIPGSSPVPTPLACLSTDSNNFSAR
jgi:hypothetical protein